MTWDSVLNEILNYVIPIGVIIWLGWILYKPFQEMFQPFWAKLSEWKDRMKGDNNQQSNIKGITYE